MFLFDESLELGREPHTYISAGLPANNNNHVSTPVTFFEPRWGFGGLTFDVCP